MSKQIFIMRHAKSDWHTTASSDFDRPLNKQGKHEAPLIGEALKKQNKIPERLVSSPALRARMTALAVAERMNKNTEEIIWNEAFYFSPASVICSFLRETPEAISSLMLFGHNPTWEELNAYLSGSYIEIKTAELIVLNYPGKWKDLQQNSCSLALHLSPKTLY